MPLPKNRWAHLLSVLMNTQNRIVKAEFSDVGDDNWSPDISSPRGSLRVACTLQANDSAVTAVIRLLLYYAVLEKLNVGQPVYGIPIPSYQAEVRFLPQVRMYFLEDRTSVLAGRARVDGRISFRVSGVTSETLTQSTVNLLADRIRAEFASGGGYVWEKGRELYTYRDAEHGLNQQIYGNPSWRGRSITQKICRVLGIEFDRAKGATKRFDEEDTRFPTNPGSVSILGKTHKLPRRLPEVGVRFQHAILDVHGLPTPIALVDRSGKLANAIHRTS